MIQLKLHQAIEMLMDSLSIYLVMVFETTDGEDVDNEYASLENVNVESISSLLRLNHCEEPRLKTRQSPVLWMVQLF